MTAGLADDHRSRVKTRAALHALSPQLRTPAALPGEPLPGHALLGLVEQDADAAGVEVHCRDVAQAIAVEVRCDGVTGVCACGLDHDRREGAVGFSEQDAHTVSLRIAGEHIQIAVAVDVGAQKNFSAVGASLIQTGFGWAGRAD